MQGIFYLFFPAAESLPVCPHTEATRGSPSFSKNIWQKYRMLLSIAVSFSLASAGMLILPDGSFRVEKINRL
jgi:hypothetical protein